MKKPGNKGANLGRRSEAPEDGPKLWKQNLKVEPKASELELYKSKVDSASHCKADFMQKVGTEV